MATDEVNNERKQRYFFTMGEIAYMDHIPLDDILGADHPWRSRLEMGWEHSKHLHDQEAEYRAALASGAESEVTK